MRYVNSAMKRENASKISNFGVKFNPKMNLLTCSYTYMTL